MNTSKPFDTELETKTGSSSAISARIDRLPLTGTAWGWVARISFGAFFEIYETSLTSLLAPLLVHAGIFHSDRRGFLGVPDLATFAAVTFAGLLVGSLLLSATSDRYGRRTVFTYALVWYALATLVMAAQSTMLAICIWRFVAALGVGAEIVVVDAYLAEMTPKAARGRAFAISTAIQFTAVPVAAIMATLLSGRSFGAVSGWRVMLAFPAIGAVLVWWVRRGLPESPRWLADRGRGMEADAIVSRLERAIERSTNSQLKRWESRPTDDDAVTANVMALFSRYLRQRTLMMAGSSCAYVIAYFGFSNWMPSLLEARGVHLTRSLAYSAIIALSFPIAPLVFTLFADRIERKWQIVIGSGLLAVAGLAFTVQSHAIGWILCGLVLTIGGNLTAYGTHTYRSELFPTRVRGRAIGLIYSLDRVSAGLSAYLVGFVLVAAGVRGVLTFVTAVSVLNMIIVSGFGPRTRGLASNEIVDRAV